MEGSVDIHCIASTKKNSRLCPALQRPVHLFYLPVTSNLLVNLVNDLLHMFFFYISTFFLNTEVSSDWNGAFNTVSLPTRHMLMLGQDPFLLLYDAQGTLLASFFDTQSYPFRVTFRCAGSTIVFSCLS